MAGLLGGSGGSSFPFKMFLMVLTVSILMPMFIIVWCPPDTADIQYSDEFNSLNQGFANMTGSQPASEEIWGLCGIYEPYSQGAYGVTSDGWIYGASINKYTPSQYANAGKFFYEVQKQEIEGKTSPLFRYTKVGQPESVGNGWLDVKVKDYYTEIHMDANKKSKLFFVESQKNTKGDKFYYDYTGYRYAFAPMRDILIEDINGDGLEAAQKSTSLSLIWYDYYSQQGISGQLIISGSDSGVASITADQIKAAFLETTSSSKFTMMFNGVDMNIYIRMDPEKMLAYSLDDCFNMGYWSIMVTSMTVTENSLITPEYALNPTNVWTTIVDMVSFDMGKYGAENGSIVSMVSIVYSLILYAFLLSLVVENIFFIILPLFLGVFQGFKLGGIL